MAMSRLFEYISDQRYMRRDRFHCHARESWESWSLINAHVEHWIGQRPANGFRLLDIGCGRFYPHLILFDHSGFAATGIDVEPVLQHSLDPVEIRMDLRIAGRYSSPFHVARTFLRNCYHRRLFFRPLARTGDFSIRRKRFDIQRMEASNLSFEDDTFDIAVSTDTFEHILDLPETVAELRRVLKPDGFAVIVIHLFPSFTGGHEPHFGYHMIRREPDQPWGHLNDTSWESDSVLNRWRDRDYLRLFRDTFRDIDRIVVTKFGGEYLSEAVLDRLPDYTEDELLTEKVMYLLYP